MESNNPLISILMTAYNREQYIGAAIESVLNSSYANFELIVVDDCSSDNTVAIAKKYELLDKRVKVYVNEVNLKDYPNRNRAASYAKGDYIKYLDSDDTIYPWGLAVMVTCMLAHPSAGYGLMTRDINLHKALPFSLSPKEAYKTFFFKGGLLSMGPSGAIIKRKAFYDAKCFSGIPYIGDIELWLKLSQKEDVVCMPSDLIWWRQHEGQQMQEEKKYIKYEEAKLEMYKNILNDSNCPLSSYESKTAIRNQYNIRARNILRFILTLKIRKAFLQTKMFRISITDFFLAFKKNKIID